MSNKERNFYVYVYYRLDTNEPFYVGKGIGNRYKNLGKRSNHFKNIANSTPITVEIVKDNLTEDEALGIECYLIHELIFEYGYSIDIKGNYSVEEGCHLVNQTWGGEGTSGFSPSEETRKKMSESHMGENNHMFGKCGELHPLHGKPLTEEHKQNLSKAHMGKKFSEEHKQNLSKAKKGKYEGENHPQYGTHHSEEWNRKISENHADVSGKNNGNAKAIICITTMEIFDTVKEAMDLYGIKSSSDIGRVCNGKRKSCGKLSDGTPLVWKFLKDYLAEQEQNNNNNIA